jgi:hypothetical protein
MPLFRAQEVAEVQRLGGPSNNEDETDTSYGCRQEHSATASKLCGMIFMFLIVCFDLIPVCDLIDLYLAQYN